MKTHPYSSSTSQAHRRRRLGWLSLAVLLASCGSSGDDSTPPAEPTGPAEPPPASDTPPLAAAAISLDDGHQVGADRWPVGNTSQGGVGQAVEGLECVDSVPNEYHVHTHLSIFLDGQALAMPQGIGIVELSPTAECHYPLHSHDATGLIHVHAAAPTDFNLGQFFRIWGHPLARDDLAGLMNLPVVVYITDDDVVSEYTGELAAIALISHREITVQVGTPITEIPRYAWTGD